jgi:hypothetical protein
MNNLSGDLPSYPSGGPHVVTRHGEVFSPGTKSSGSNTVGPVTARCRVARAARVSPRRQRRSSSGGSAGSPKGWWNLPGVRRMRFGPSTSATAHRFEIRIVGRPAFSNSRASVAPLRVPVPQVAGETTAVTPLALSSSAISAAKRAISATCPPLPTVT